MRPRTDADPTARPYAGRPSRITATTCVHEARASLAATGERAAIIYRCGQPVGIVTAQALTDALAAGHASAPVATVMDHVVVAVDRAADPYATVRTFTDAAWRWLRGQAA